MKIKLLKDIEQGNTLKVVKRRGKYICFLEGTVVEVSETTAQKWIKEGLAEEYKELTK